MTFPDVTKHIKMDARYFPALISLLTLSMFLFNFRNLTESLKNWLVPSLAVYVLGTTLVAYVQSMLLIRRSATSVSAPEARPEAILTSWQFYGFILPFHVIFFISFVIYNIWRGNI